MLRLTGILTGSALAIAVLLYTIGIPQITELRQPVAASPEGEQAVQDEIVVVADLPTTEPHEDGLAAVPRLEPEPEPESTPRPNVQTASEQSSVPVDVGADTTAATLAGGQETAAVESKWFAFWSPFRSAIAADGFVSELQRTTGLDYRVVKLKPGVYEVAFAYSDDTDREDKLSRISAATGLDVSGG